MYERPDSSAPLEQGDMIDDCPIVFWDPADTDDISPQTVCKRNVRALVLTQTCDLENRKSTRVQVAVVHTTQRLVDTGILKPATIRDNVRLHRVFGWYFLEESAVLPESIVDFRDVHTLPRGLLESLVEKGRRVCRLATPYREHLAQHFAVTFSRIALPRPAKSVD
jgi:hypothetical protein